MAHAWLRTDSLFLPCNLVAALTIFAVKRVLVQDISFAIATDSAPVKPTLHFEYQLSIALLPWKLHLINTYVRVCTNWFWVQFCTFIQKYQLGMIKIKCVFELVLLFLFYMCDRNYSDTNLSIQIHFFKVLVFIYFMQVCKDIYVWRESIWGGSFHVCRGKEETTMEYVNINK